MYEGSIEVALADGTSIVIPVSVAVTATGTQSTFGGVDQSDSLYDNGAVFGYTDYSWRQESGDWRFFWTDVAAEDLPASGTSYLLVENSWQGDRTDIDTIILGPQADTFGPTLGEVGRSEYTYVGSGRWAYATSSGTSTELVAAPLTAGLHGILFHQVMVDGEELADPFEATTGMVHLDPATAGGTGSGSTDITISTELALDGFVAEGFGLGAPVVTTESIQQDDPNDPTTASFVKTVTVENGALLEVSTGNSANGSDLDLYLYGPDGSLIGSSTTPTDAESVSVLFPEDGTYTIAVHGWSVPAGTDTFDLTVNAVQGHDVSVTDLPGAIPAGGSDTVTIAWDVTGFEPGTYYGLVLMGPATAPGLFQVPVEVTVP